MNTPHLLVIGGTGFIGHHLLKVAQQKGWQITSVSLSPPTEERFVDDVRYLHLDLTDRSLVNIHLDEDFNYVVNLGGYINHKLFKDGGRNLINSHFTIIQNLLEVLPRSNLKRFVQIGSSDEYGNVITPKYENMREEPISPYSLAKVASTHLLQMLHRTENFPAVIIRLFLTYGPGQDFERFLPQIIQGCLNDEIFPASTGEQLRDFCFVGDTVNAIVKALLVNNLEGQIFNIGSGIPISIKEVITKVEGIIGMGKPLYGAIPYRVGENMSLYAEIENAKTKLNWSPKINLEEGLKKTIKWYSECKKWI
jgi:nucleoside-diphosphate-sugar epimerase